MEVPNNVCMNWFTEVFVYHEGSWVVSLSVHDNAVIHLKLNSSTVCIHQEIPQSAKSTFFNIINSLEFSVKLNTCKTGIIFCH